MSAGRESLSDVTPGYVYFLADPRTPRHPRYVGSTKQPALRAHQHQKDVGAGNAAFADWKQSLRAAGVAPLLVIVSDYPSVADALEAEWRIAARWQRRGLSDLNRPPNMFQAFACERNAINARRRAA
jgi:predicted GIY-YIG superfamily endonuclease